MKAAPESMSGFLYYNGIWIFIFRHSKYSVLLQSNAGRKQNTLLSCFFLEYLVYSFTVFSSGVLAHFPACYVNRPHDGGDENESFKVSVGRKSDSCHEGPC